MRYTLQVAPDDCTGCGLCVEVCPAKNKSETRPQGDQHGARSSRVRAPRAARLGLLPRGPRPRSTARRSTCDQVKDVQLLEPLFEFSGACAGCGETPYLKLLSQLFGDRAVIANATGCSSIYGGNLPTTPWTTNRDGPRAGVVQLALRGQRRVRPRHAPGARQAERHTPASCSSALAPRARHSRWSTALLDADQTDEAGIAAQRERVAELQRAAGGDRRAGGTRPRRRRRHAGANERLDRRRRRLGLRHRLRRPRPRAGQRRATSTSLVLDTEVYSNTGGQMSKATPRGAVAKFAAGGKPTAKKDLGLMAMTYGNVYVAQVAMGANDMQTLRAFLEAEAYDGPSLIIAYSHCIAHGIDMAHGHATSRRPPSPPGTGRSTATTRGCAATARTRSSSTRRRRACRSRSTSTTRPATRCSPSPTPRRRHARWRSPKATSRRAGACTRTWRRCRETAPTRRKETADDRPRHALPRPRAAEPDRALRVAALREHRQPEARGGRGRGRRRPALAVRGADRDREPRSRSQPLARRPRATPRR